MRTKTQPIKEPKLKEHRQKLGITIGAISKLIGASRILVTKWETGEVVPRADKIPYIVNAYEASFEDLYPDLQIKVK